MQRSLGGKQRIIKWGAIALVTLPFALYVVYFFGVIAFLNTHDESLGGRPIDLAVESADGLEAVARLLETRAAPGAA